MQLSTGQDVVAEAVIHAMRDIIADVGMDAVLLIDSENVFLTLYIVWKCYITLNLFAPSLLLP